MPEWVDGGISFLPQMVLLIRPRTPNLNPLFVGFNWEDCEKGPLCRKLAEFTEFKELFQPLEKNL